CSAGRSASSGVSAAGSRSSSRKKAAARSRSATKPPSSPGSQPRVAQPRPLAFQFNRGMRQDEPREQMVAGAAWNLVDYLPQFGGPLAKRGGWEYASPDLATVHPSASYVQAVAHAPFEAGAK